MNTSEIKYVSMMLDMIARDMEDNYMTSIEMCSEKPDTVKKAYYEGIGEICDAYGCEIRNLARRLERVLKENEE